MRFVIQRSNNNQYYFEIQSDNNKTLASSETYWNKADCRSAAELVRTQAATAIVVDNA